MRPISTTILTLLASAGASAAATPESEYHERLDLKPLPNNALLASFNFKAQQAVDELEKHNFRLFPRSLGQILDHSGAKELHLRFALGRWDAEGWGARPWGGKKEGGTGVEIWAWLDAETDEEAAQKWRMLTNTLSGLFCASLNFIDETRTTYPRISFEPEGDHNATGRLLHGVLPHEVVCTENLTPFLKMLPCKGKAGIATLLNGHKLFDASWQSMAVDVRPVCNGEKCMVEIDQTIDMVVDIPRSKRPKENPIPHPPPADSLNCDPSRPYFGTDACYPIDQVPGQDWSLSAIFGKTMISFCPLAPATESSVCVTIPSKRTVLASGAEFEVRPTEDQRCFSVRPSENFDLEVPFEANPNIKSYVDRDTPELFVERSLTGHGQEHGGVQVLLTNPSSTKPVEFVYMESLPWFMRVYVHSLQTRLQNSSTADPFLITQTVYRPGLDRARGSQLEVALSVPPASTVILTYSFEKAILRYTEYPPDANRGFDVASAIIKVKNGGEVRTTGLLLYLPTPDFSMPYNVIIFTSTTIALVFGGMYNLLVRRMVGEREAPVGFVKGKVDALKAVIRQLKGGQ